MLDIKDYVLDYIEEYDEGNIDDIVRYLLENEILIKNLKELKELIEKILGDLKKQNLIDFLPTTKKFHKLISIRANAIVVPNDYSSAQNILTATLLYEKETIFDFEKLNQFLYDKLNLYGKYSIKSADNKKMYLIAIFETSLIEVNISFSNYTLILRSNMKQSVLINEPILEYISKISNKSLKKEKSIFIPINYGIYLVYQCILDYIKEHESNYILEIISIDFSYEGVI